MAIDLSETLDIGTNFPDTWKTIVRELLLKFETEATYTHHNIVGNRPYHINLKITIDDPVDDETYDELHMKSQQRDKQIEEIIKDFENALEMNDEELEAHAEELKQEILMSIKQEKERLTENGN